MNLKEWSNSDRNFFFSISMSSKTRYTRLCSHLYVSNTVTFSLFSQETMIYDAPLCLRHDLFLFS
jgi:hypothetical protein